MSITPGWFTSTREEWVTSVRKHAKFERTLMLDAWAIFPKDPCLDNYYVRHRQHLVAISIMEGLVT